MPKVSIITPMYNPTVEQYEASAEGIAAQSNKDFEWIVIDDGSTNLDERLASFVRLGSNFGPSVARNVGFQVSSGDIITYLDMGDEISPHRVDNIIDQFSKFEIDFLFSAYYIRQYDQPYLVNHLDIIGKHSKFPDAHEYLKILQRQNITIPLGVAHTRVPFVMAGGFQRGYSLWGGWYFVAQNV